MKSIKLCLLLLLVMLLWGCSAQKQDGTTAPEPSKDPTIVAGDEDWGEETILPTDDQQTVTQPTQGGEEEPQPTEGVVVTQPTEPAQGDSLMSFADYLALTPEQRQAYVQSFPSMEEAMLWYESAKKAYEDSKDTIDITGGNIDLGDILDGMGN